MHDLWTMFNKHKNVNRHIKTFVLDWPAFTAKWLNKLRMNVEHFLAK